jgi:vesicle-fusing ATPase
MPLPAPAGQAPIKVTGQKGFATNQLFKSRTLSFEALGIGGLDSQFESIFRRAFASRVFPPSILERLGIHHVKVRMYAGAGWGGGGGIWMGGWGWGRLV